MGELMQRYFQQPMSLTGRPGPTNLSFEKTSINQLVTEIVDSQKAAWSERRLRLEMDIQPMEAHINVQLIQLALSGLLVNAIQNTPYGGEITVTSIDGTHQWEIEVADSSQATQFQTAEELQRREDEEELPVLLTFPVGDHLRTAYKAAFDHGGDIQSWECPQGGLAYLLVVPRRKLVNAA